MEPERGRSGGFPRRSVPRIWPGADRAAVEKFFDWAETPEEADFALVRIESPLADGGYTAREGYIPISLPPRPGPGASAMVTSGRPTIPTAATGARPAILPMKAIWTWC